VSDFLDRVSKMSPKRLALLALELQGRVEALEGAAPEPLAVVGLGCRFPGGADSPAAFWELLRRGDDAITEVPRDRWDVDAYYDPDPDVPGKMATRFGGFLRDVDRFDAQFFGITPREAASMDPQQRLLLEVAWEALEDAGQAPDALTGSATGVFVGMCNADYFHRIVRGDPAGLDAYVATGGAHSVAAGRVAYLLGLQGPNVAIDTACSSSLVAVHLACQSLRSGECRMALAGGVNLILAPETTIILSRAHMMAPDGRCKAFDARADGFVRAEGCGLVVLKRLSDARADGDRVLAVIRGTAVNQDGRSNGLTAPNGPAQEAVVRAALANARLAPHQVAYVEAHGTGTSLGDPIEMRALGAALGAGRASDRPVLVGSLKTNIGHLESAAGVAGLIKVILALQHGEIPAQLHFQTPNPYIPWAELPVAVASEARPWPAGLHVAGVSSFGFSGTNVHLIVEAAPAPAAPAQAPAQPAHVLALSARSEAALRALAGRWAEWLDPAPAPLADLCATASSGRATFDHRLAVTAETPEQARERLRAFAEHRDAPGVITGRARRSRTPEVAFLFPGQGAQYAGMGRALYAASEVFRAAVERVGAALGAEEATRLRAVVQEAETTGVDETATAQVALFAVEWGLAEVWRAWGVRPAVVVGHSVGEFAAACVAGVMEVEAAARLVAARGRLMGALPAGGAMVAVGAGEAAVEVEIAVVRAAGAGDVGLAAVNGPESVVVSGAAAAVAAVVAGLGARGIGAQALRVSHAFHSGLMAPMQEAFAAAVAGERWGTPAVTWVSTVTGQALAAVDAAYWVRQVREPVRFAAAMETVQRQLGDGIWLELGPHPVLTGLGRPWLAGGEWVPTLRRGHDDWQTLLGAAATLWTRGLSIDWRGGEPARPRRVVGGLPTYPFERERHWLEAAPRPELAPAAASTAHPLLGRRIRSAGPTPQFEVRLAAGSPAFLADHRVHGLAIAPSPVQIEMAMAAATEVLGDARPVVTDFVIEQPLVLPEGGSLVVQTVVTPGDAGRVTIEIASLEDEAASRWRVHARATAQRHESVEATDDADPDLAAVRLRCREEIAAADYYAMLRERGLDFGPSFRGIARLWRGDRESLGEIVVPGALLAERGRYRVHPAVLDACLQVLGGAWPASDEETYLLVGADRIVLPGAAGAAGPRFSHAVLRAGDAKGELVTGDVQVLDEAGRCIARVEGVRLRRARPESLARHRVLPTSDWMYRVQWRTATPTAIAAPAGIARALDARFRAIATAEGLSVYDELLPALEALSLQYVLRALGELGWTPAPGERVDASTLAAALGVEARHGRLFARLLGILGEEGLLRRLGTAWEVVQPLPPGDAAPLEREIGARFPTGAAEVRVTLDCGRALASVLRGRTDPLDLLFSPGALANTESLYTASPAARTYNAVVARAVVEAMAPAAGGRRVRILEIGAGTGGTTSAVLPALPVDAGEYVFTDVSPTLTARAAERLAGPHRRFLPLDIERDPASQGLAGERFDIVLAANVLHATRDLRQTLAHVRGLLAPGGLVILLEGTARYRWVDLTFGLTEGWWRFTDRELRPDHALLGAEQWLDLLPAAGLVEPHRLPAVASGRALASQTVLIAKAGAAAAAPVAANVGWVVLADRGGVAAGVAALLESRGERAALVAAGEDAVAAVADLVRSGRTSAGVVDLRSLDVEMSPAHDAAVTAMQTAGQVLGVVRSLARGEGAARLWLVTRGAQPVGEHVGSVALAQAPIWGLGRVLALEHPERWGGLIDLDPAEAPAPAAEHVVAQLTAADEEDQVAFRDGTRYVPRLVRAPETPGQPVTVRADGAYLVTGGLGGLGLHVARWLVEQGARHLVLLARRGLPPRESWTAARPGEELARQTGMITRLEALGARVDVVSADVTDRAAMTALLASFGGVRPPLRGIVHAAAHLRAEPLAETTDEALAAVFGPKVTGAWLLHELGRDLSLDFFVLFSSTTALIGSGRLGHYAAANQFLDALAHQRRAEGLPSLSVNWGTWDEMRAVSEAERRSFAQAGLLPMRTEDALAVLGRLAGGPAAQAVVASVDWGALVALYEVKRPRPFLAELRARPTAAPAPAARPRPADLAVRLEGLSGEARRDLLAAHVRGEAAMVLGLSEARIDPDQGLFDMGMDSLMAVDLKTRLEAAVGHRLPSTLTFNYPTVTALAGYLADEVLGSRPAADSPASPAAPTPADASRDDLSEDELAALLAEKLGRIR
jgi:acyl transferase domain-containing protein/acyl carrier protein